MLHSFIFTGAAILYKEAAAYQQTAIAAEADAEQETPMSKQILEELGQIKRQLDEMKAEQDAAHEEAAESETDAETETAAEKDTDAGSETEAAEDTEAAAALSAMKTLMKAMGYKDEEAAEDQSAMMKHMMRAMFYSMAYPGGGFGGEHGDEAEDIALFKRMMRQGRMEAKDGKTASMPVPGMAAMQKQLKDIHAAMGLITDTLKRQTGLITDMAQKMRGLSTDENRGNNGGPVRKSMSAEQGEQWAGKFDGKEVEGGAQDLATAMSELDAQMDKENIRDITVRMARKIDLQSSFLNKKTAAARQ